MCEHACLWMCMWGTDTRKRVWMRVCCCCMCMYSRCRRWKRGMKKRKKETCAPLQWKYLTHGWLFIIANDSVVLSGSRKNITHWTREKIEMEYVSSYIFIHLLLCVVSGTWCGFKENTGNPHNATLNVPLEDRGVASEMKTLRQAKCHVSYLVLSVAGNRDDTEETDRRVLSSPTSNFTSYLTRGGEVGGKGK